MNTPIDATHSECLKARDWVRAAFGALRSEASVWEPAPCPARPARARRLARIDGELFADDPLVRRAMRRDGLS